MKNLSDFVYSIKHDGIRIRIQKGFGTTRGGMVIDLAGMKLPFGDETDDLEYDGELIHGSSSPGPDNVMKELNGNSVEKLHVKVFDLVDLDLTFQKRYEKLIRRLGRRSIYLVPQFPVERWSQLEQKLRDVQVNGGEGLVLRNVTSKYTKIRRSVKIAFKMKKFPEDSNVSQNLDTYSKDKCRYVTM
jgi:ATP-dependent DNA ligase